MLAFNPATVQKCAAAHTKSLAFICQTGAAC
jgi:hypothetical protein